MTDLPSFFLGLAESLAWGWYVALVFAPLYNFFAARAGNAAAGHTGGTP